MNPRQLIIPGNLIKRFLKKAQDNTSNNIETCAILAGKLSSNRLIVTHLLIPKQSGTSVSCTSKNEEEILECQIKQGLMTLGWIHTHPSQTSFMSSIDLHTHCSYQLMMPEAIAIVCAPTYNESNFFFLTPHHGLHVIADCKLLGEFHSHNMEDEIYAIAKHYVLDDNLLVNVVDFRESNFFFSTPHHGLHVIDDCKLLSEFHAHNMEDETYAIAKNYVLEDNLLVNVVDFRGARMAIHNRPLRKIQSTKSAPDNREVRQVPVLEHRIKALNENWSKILKTAIDYFGMDIRFDRKSRNVKIRNPVPDDEIGSQHLQKAADFVKAFVNGYRVEDALALIMLDNLSADYFENINNTELESESYEENIIETNNWLMSKLVTEREGLVNKDLLYEMFLREKNVIPCSKSKFGRIVHATFKDVKSTGRYFGKVRKNYHQGIKLKAMNSKEQTMPEALTERIRKAPIQIEQMNSDLANERATTQKLETNKMLFDRQNKELKAKLAEIANLDEQMKTETKEIQLKQKAIHKLEKKMKDDKRTIEQYKEQVEKIDARVKSKKRQIEKAKEEIKLIRRRIGATGSKRGSTIDDLSTIHGSSLDDSLESNNGSNDSIQILFVRENKKNKAQYRNRIVLN